MLRSPARYRHTGFTLIELLVILIILGIVAALALPSFQETIARNRLVAQHNEVMAAFSLARAEAIKRNAPVAFCAANADQNACVGAWDLNWLVWQDDDSDGVVDGTEEVLQVGGITDAEGFSSPGSHTLIRFSPRGLRALPTSATPTASLVIRPDKCPTGKKLQRTISVLITGATTSTQDDC